jgi:transcription elongation factor GreA
MIEAIKQKLTREVEQLNHELNVTLPEALKKALQQGDLRENGDYHAALERQQFVHARLSHLRSRLAKLSQIDLSKVPKDRVGLGSRVEVQDADTEERETYELVIPDAMDMDAGHISVASPLGRALLDRKAGESVAVRLPAGTRKLKILKVVTLHQQVNEDA